MLAVKKISKFEGNDMMKKNHSMFPEADTTSELNVRQVSERNGIRTRAPRTSCLRDALENRNLFQSDKKLLKTGNRVSGSFV